MCITFGDFTLPNHFSKLFETLTTVRNRRKGALISPQNPKPYTKVAAKANPLRA
jgi:hypothetical protein